MTSVVPRTRDMLSSQNHAEITPKGKLSGEFTVCQLPETPGDPGESAQEARSGVRTTKDLPAARARAGRPVPVSGFRSAERSILPLGAPGRPLEVERLPPLSERVRPARGACTGRGHHRLVSDLRVCLTCGWIRAHGGSPFWAPVTSVGKKHPRRWHLDMADRLWSWSRPGDESVEWLLVDADSRAYCEARGAYQG